MKKPIIYILFAALLISTVSAATMIREMPTETAAGGSFDVTYRVTEEPVGNWGVLLEDDISGGCTPTDLNTGWLSPQTTYQVTFTAPSSGSCTFTGNYQFGDSGGSLPETDFPIQTITITSTVCTPHSYYLCYNNDLYWYNSCNSREDMKEDCETSGLGSTYCLDNDVYQHYYVRGCSQGSCTEVDNPIFIESCEPDYVCENGACVEHIESKISIEKIKFTYDGKSKTAKDGDTVRNIKPGMDLKVKIYVENLFTEDIEIEDIEITATIENIDEGDDLEEESDEFDVKAGKTKSETLTFEIPLLVDEDEYTMTIEVEGEDENNVKHETEAKIELEVEKEKHKLMIHKAILDPKTLSCDGVTFLDLEVINLGSEDEEEVVITLVNEELDFNKKEELELDSGDDEETIFSTSYFIQVTEGLAAGTYPIEIKVYYNTNRLEDTKTVDLMIEECPVEEEVEEETTCESGCLSGDNCYPEGTSGIQDSQLLYCDGSYWVNKKEDMTECSEDYECENNSCTEGLCQVIEKTKHCFLFWCWYS